MREYELFLDESGRFTEGMRDDGRRFPSQIAGLIAPAGKITARAAEELLGEVLASIERPLPAVVHANEWKKGAEFDRLVLALSGSLRKRSGWQAIRLENREGLGFGAIESTYTRMVAELCVRALEQVTKGDDGEVKLRVIAASYWVDGEAQLGADAYVERLEEHLAYAALRRGLAAESARWKLAGIRFESGRTRRELQLCDLLSNASHSGYGKLGAEARTALERCFAGYDFRLTVRELSRRVDEHLEEGSFGLALQALAEELCSPEALSADARRDAEARLSAVVEGLAALSAAVRAPQLAVLTVWLEQLIEQRRDAVMGLRAARWLAANVEAPLSAQVGDSLAPFSLALSRHALTAANHQGALGAAREAVSAIQRLIPQLAGRWEHGPVILECMVAESVHLTDTLEHEAVARRMGAVAAYYETLSSLLSDALEGVFPEAVRSEQRGRALGTQMQAEMYAGLADPLRFEEARRLNEEAMRELGAPEEIARQQQYRCQLETFAGEAASAWPRACRPSPPTRRSPPASSSSRRWRRASRSCTGCGWARWCSHGATPRTGRRSRRRSRARRRTRSRGAPTPSSPTRPTA